MVSSGEKAVDIQHPSKLQEEDVHNDCENLLLSYQNRLLIIFR